MATWLVFPGLVAYNTKHWRENTMADFILDTILVNKTLVTASKYIEMIPLVKIFDK